MTMNVLLFVSLAAIAHLSYASFDMGFDAFDVLISKAIVTDLNQSPANITEVNDEGYARLSLPDDNHHHHSTLTSGPTLLSLSDEEIGSLAKDTSCGFCEARLLWGDTGVIQSPSYPNSYPPDIDCMWLLRAADEDARIELTCDDIQLESCGAQNGFSPSWRDYLIISPLWNFRKSWVYCGTSTAITAIKHTSICDQMAITFRSNSNDKRYRGFHCTYKVI